MRQRSIYLAGPFDWASKIADVAFDIRFNTQHLITTSWHDHEDKNMTPLAIAQVDIAALKKSDTLVLIPDKVYIHDTIGPPSDSFSVTRGGGGCSIEFGWALASHLDVFVVGPLNSVFHHLVPSRCRYKTSDELVHHLTMESNYGK